MDDRSELVTTMYDDETRARIMSEARANVADRRELEADLARRLVELPVEDGHTKWKRDQDELEASRERERCARQREHEREQRGRERERAAIEAVVAAVAASDVDARIAQVVNGLEHVMGEVIARERRDADAKISKLEARIGVLERSAAANAPMGANAESANVTMVTNAESASLGRSDNLLPLPPRPGIGRVRSAA
jgi:hypothetical protein